MSIVDGQVILADDLDDLSSLLGLWSGISTWPRCRAYIATDNSIASGTANVTGWSEEYDIGAGFDPSTGKYTVPAGQGGRYRITYTVSFPSASTRRCIQVMRGAETICSMEGPATGFARLSCATTRTLAAGDVLDVQIYTGSATQVRGTVQVEVIFERIG